MIDPGPPERSRARRWAAGSLTVLLCLWVGGGLVAGWVFLRTVRALLAGVPPPPAPVVQVRDVPIALADLGRAMLGQPTRTPAAPAAPPTATPAPEEPLPAWDGSDRVTVLLLGIDQRPDEKAARVPARSDTMILVTLDPLNLTGAMLSLPRDLWVPIKGHGENKLNTAHFWGDADRYWTGPELARQTVQYNLGVPVHYYARVDFAGFVELIDALGGITVDVDRAILDDEYPSEDYGLSRLYLPVGPQRMSGALALKYARTRHTDSDFGRTQRQRRVLQAAREEALAVGLIPRLPRMLGIVRDAVATDVPPTTLLALANLARRVPSGAIASRQIDTGEVIDVNGDGTVLLPDREKIRPIVQELFYDPVVKKEAARVEVLNGTAREGLATATRAALQARGYTVVRADSADRRDLLATTVVDRAGKAGTASRLAALLGAGAADARTEPGGPGAADVTVVLGADFRGLR